MQGGPGQQQGQTTETQQWSPQPGGGMSPPPQGEPMGPGPGPGAGVPGRTPGLATASMVVGIVGLCLVILFHLFAILVPIVALVLGILAKRAYDRDPTLGGRGIMKAGIILGIIGIVVGLVWGVLILLFLESIFERLQQEAENQIVPLISW